MSCLLIILALIPVITVCQRDCAYPTADDLESVIADVIASGVDPTPIVNVTNFHPVCLAHSQERDRYRFLSVVVEYTCFNNSGCPNGSAVEQIETQCLRGTWDSEVQGSTDHTRTLNPTASFSTEVREDCVYCVSVDLIHAFFLHYDTDSLTHCVGKFIIGVGTGGPGGPVPTQCFRRGGLAHSIIIQLLIELFWTILASLILFIA